jgi:hypothetical protein
VFLFILAIVLTLVAVAAVFTRRRVRADEELRAGALVVLVVAVIGAVTAGFFSSFTAVDANTVGIVTAYGQPVGTVDSGPHMLAPWDSVDPFTTRVQVTDRKAGPEGDVPGADCVQVNLKGGAQACADMTLRYVINPGDAVDLWKRYGDFDTVRDKLLRSATDNAAKIVYGQYAPQDAISGDALPAITKAMTGELTKQLNDSGLTLVAVAPGQLHLQADVQNRINDILNAQTATTVAQQNLAKNQAEAQANAALTGSLSEPILIQQCIDAAKVIKPAVFNCFPGGSGSGTPLVNVNPGH